MTHEVGHWLGLYHTFENGCYDPGDLIDDTSAHDNPDFDCDGSLDTCPSEGENPIENFMNYTPDACMKEFNAGQFTRMLAEWNAFREGTEVTYQPTPQLSTSPTIDCEDQVLTVSIPTDRYYSRNSWSVAYSSNGTEIMSVPSYSSVNEIIGKSACVDMSRGCMTLTLNGSYGDGILTDNSITAEVDGEEFYNSGMVNTINPFSVWIAFIGVKNDCADYTLQPSGLPSKVPSDFPSESMRPSKSNLPSVWCAGIYIKIKTDQHPNEISWIIDDASGNILYLGGSYNEIFTVRISVLYLHIAMYLA